jgi:hypothetical protein
LRNVLSGYSAWQGAQFLPPLLDGTEAPRKKQEPLLGSYRVLHGLPNPAGCPFSTRLEGIRLEGIPYYFYYNNYPRQVLALCVSVNKLSNEQRSVGLPSKVAGISQRSNFLRTNHQRRWPSMFLTLLAT